VELEEIEAKLLADAQPKIDAARKLWREVRGYTEAEANDILTKRNLPEDFVITNNDNSTFTGKDVWNNPDAYHGKSDIRDPLEPEYGKTKAKIFVNKDDAGGVDSITIHSQAHGGVTYRLEKPVAMMLEGLGITPPDNDDLVITEKDISHHDLAKKLGSKFFYDDARYAADWGKWLLWDGSRWLIDAKGYHLHVMGKYLKQCSASLMAYGDSAMSTRIREARNLNSAGFRKSIEAVIKTDPKCAVESKIFDNNNDIIGTPEGTVDLRTGQISEALPEHNITKSTNVSLKEARPVQWLKFLDKIFDGDAAMIAFIQRMCGYILTGLTGEEKLFFLYGTGANGKSIFLDILTFIMGDYAKRAPASLFLEQRGEEHPTALAGLCGSRLVVGSELPDGKTWKEETIKDLQKDIKDLERRKKDK